MEATAVGQKHAPLDNLCVNTIRTLSMNALQAANSSHPGTPTAIAPVAYPHRNNIMRFDPENFSRPNRARFSALDVPRLNRRRYVNCNEAIDGMRTFGASAPLKELTGKFGFTVENAAKREIKKFKSWRIAVKG